MRRYKWLYLSLALCLWPLSARAVTRDTFLIRYTQDLIELCSAQETDPLYAAATGFCYGYLIGIYQYQVASQEDPKGLDLFCMSDPPPSREQGIKMFVSWVKQNPQYMGEKAVDTIARFLSTQWPCK